MWKFFWKCVIAGRAGNQAEETQNATENVVTIGKIHEQTNTTNESAQKIQEATAFITSIADAG